MWMQWLERGMKYAAVWVQVSESSCTSPEFFTGEFSVGENWPALGWGDAAYAEHRTLIVATQKLKNCSKNIFLGRKKKNGAL